MVWIYWPAFFKSVKIMKDEQRNHTGLKEAKESWQLNAVGDPGLDPRPEVH